MLRSIGLVFLAFYGALASAEFELKAHYGQLNGKPKSFNEDAESNYTGWPDVENVKLIGADAIYAVPIIGLAIGIRHEMFNFSKDGNVTVLGFPFDVETKLTGARTSLLGGWRLIELPVGYIGLLAHYAISQNMTYDAKVGTTTSKYKATVRSSYGAGVDAGLHLGILALGAEVGYTILKADNFKDADGSYLTNADGSKSEMDLSGTYFKAMLGVTF